MNIRKTDFLCIPGHQLGTFKRSFTYNIEMYINNILKGLYISRLELIVSINSYYLYEYLLFFFSYRKAIGITPNMHIM